MSVDKLVALHVRLEELEAEYDISRKKGILRDIYAIEDEIDNIEEQGICIPNVPTTGTPKKRT